MSGLSHTHACSTSDKQINVGGAKTKAAYPEPSLESLMFFFIHMCGKQKGATEREAPPLTHQGCSLPRINLTKIISELNLKDKETGRQ